MIQILSLTALDAKLSQRLIKRENIDVRYSLNVFVCFGVYRPTRELFTQVQTSPLPVKGCQF